jgi:hypothetical protein
MFNLERSIGEWVRQMAAAGIASESLNELESHLRDDIEHGIRQGQGAQAAFEDAVKRLGSADRLKGEFGKDARRIVHRHSIQRAMFFGTAAFLTGTALCYYALLPIILNASAAYAKWLGFSAVRWNSHDYLFFALRFVLVGGLCFEIPVVILTLVKLGFIDYRFLSRARKYVIIINLILGAVLTTPEVITQLVMFVPLQILYEVTVWFTWARQRPGQIGHGTPSGNTGAL